MNIKELIKECLSIPVMELSEPLQSPCATYYLDSERSGLTGDGKEQEVEETYMIDLWYKERVRAIESSRLLRKRITDSPYNTIQAANYQYDTNGKLWRAMVVFLHVKEAENE